MSERLTLRVRHVPGVPIVAARAWLPAGARVESIPGEALIAGRGLTEGTTRRSWDEIADEADRRGIAVDSVGSYETLGVSVDALAGLWPEVVDELTELVREATLPDDRTVFLCRQAAAELLAMDDQPEVRTARAFVDQLYYPHAYGRPLQGNLDSLATLDPESCRRHREAALRRGLLVVVAGDIDEDAVRAKLEACFGDLRGPAEPLPVVPAPVGRDVSRIEVALPKADQAHLWLGHLTVPRTHPDRFALATLAVVLGAGAGLSGRLPTRIREREGLAYHVEVATAAGAGHDPGRFSVYLATAPRNLEQAEASVRDELARLLDDGITTDELHEARAYLLGRQPFRYETARQWADRLTEAAFYGVPVDRPGEIAAAIHAVDQEAVEAAARRWIRPDELRVTVGVPG